MNTSQRKINSTNEINLLHHDLYSHHPPETAYADSGCTSHFLKSTSHCINKQPTSNGIRVKLPDGTIIQSTHTALLDLPELPIEARRAHVFPNLNNSALISISQFCDQGFEASFTQQEVQIKKGEHVIISGQRDPITGL